MHCRSGWHLLRSILLPPLLPLVVHLRFLWWCEAHSNPGEPAVPAQELLALGPRTQGETEHPRHPPPALPFAAATPACGCRRPRAFGAPHGRADAAGTRLPSSLPPGPAAHAPVQQVQQVVASPSWRCAAGCLQDRCSAKQQAAPHLAQPCLLCSLCLQLQAVLVWAGLHSVPLVHPPPVLHVVALPDGGCQLEGVLLPGRAIQAYAPQALLQLLRLCALVDARVEPGNELAQLYVVRLKAQRPACTWAAHQQPCAQPGSRAKGSVARS